LRAGPRYGRQGFLRQLRGRAVTPRVAVSRKERLTCSGQWSPVDHLQPPGAGEATDSQGPSSGNVCRTNFSTTGAGPPFADEGLGKDSLSIISRSRGGRLTRRGGGSEPILTELFAGWPLVLQAGTFFAGERRGGNSVAASYPKSWTRYAVGFRARFRVRDY